MLSVHYERRLATLPDEPLAEIIKRVEYAPLELHLVSHPLHRIVVGSLHLLSSIAMHNERCNRKQLYLEHSSEHCLDLYLREGAEHRMETMALRCNWVGNLNLDCFAAQQRTPS